MQATSPRGEDRAGTLDVVTDLSHHCVDALEFLLVTDPLHQQRLGIGAVDVTAEVEDEHLHRETVLAKGGTIADVHRTLKLGSAHVNSDRVDASSRHQLVGGHGQVGGGVADAASRATSTLDKGADRVLAT